MSLLANMVREDALRVTNGEAVIGVHLPWFRSLPLSCVGPIGVTVDDVRLPAEAIRFRLGVGVWPVAELADLHDREWYVLDEAQLVLPRGLVPGLGASAQVRVHMDLRIPDILIGPGVALTNDNRIERPLVVRS